VIAAQGRARQPTEVLRRLAESASVELTPGEVDGHLESLRPTLSPGTRIFITALAGRPLDDQLAAAQRIAAAGFEPVPHVAARAYRDLGELEARLGRLAGRAGVREVLVVAGGQTPPAGALSSSLEVLRSSVIQAAGIRRVAVAGYPEGIRGIPAEAVGEALAEKNELAAADGLDMRIVTQFAFDAAAYLDWERAARAAGNRLPVTVGLPGVVAIAKLLRFAAICGIGPSTSILRKQARGVLRLASRRGWKPDEVLAGISAGVASDPDSLIDALHLFAFGNVTATAEWLHELTRSSLLSGARAR
jgi:methylenetetrahydrofolate reductase (NADPH)